MKGTIAIDPTYTQGTRTIIAVPLPEASAEDVAALRRELSQSPAPELSELTLPPQLSWLLVDDSSDVRLWHRRALGKGGKGWTFAEASTGEAAIAMVAGGQRFDVIVVDMYMSKAGGSCSHPHNITPHHCAIGCL